MAGDVSGLREAAMDAEEATGAAMGGAMGRAVLDGEVLDGAAMGRAVVDGAVSASPGDGGPAGLPSVDRDGPDEGQAEVPGRGPEAGAAGNIIELRGVSKIFGGGDGEVAALRNVDLDIARGDFVAIMGQSGSGKTTLMNLIGCLDAPTAGSLVLDGRRVEELGHDERSRLRGRTLGFVFQRYNLLAALSAVDNVALPAVYAGTGRRERTERAAGLMEDLGLGDKLAGLPHQLSGGQQQRVSIARALMNGAQVVLADEPSGALDTKSGEMVMDVLADLHRRGRTVIVVTHDPRVAARADRVVELRDGEVVGDRRRRPVRREGPEPPPPPGRAGPLRRLAGVAGQLAEAMRMSLQAIGSHKLRSTLTMLGIIIGIASVVSVVALGRGSRERVLADIGRIGASTITINPGSGFGDRRSGRVRTLTVADSELLGRQDYIDSSTPSVSTSGVLVHANQALNASLTGVGEAYFRARSLSAARGRLLTPMDVLESASVCVLDDNAARELMPDDRDPVGEIVMFRRQPLRVVGVTAPQESSGPQGQLNLWAPYTTVMTKITGDSHIGSIIVKVAADVDTTVAELGLTELLKVRHGGRQDFHTQNSDTIRQTIESATATMTLLISSIALISLLVGGIGVMNIMLVSVTERTNEIGVRMAVGAGRLDILEQFLIEAVLLCLMGGAAGVALSGLAGLAFNNLTRDFHMSFSTGSILLALACSTLAGVVFGFLPARGTSRLNPIEALAHE